MKKILSLILIGLLLVPTLSFARGQNDKPMLGSQINWGHPLSKGLVGCWLMNERGGNVYKDLASGALGASVVNRPWLPTKLGIGSRNFQTTLSTYSAEYIDSNNNKINTNSNGLGHTIIMTVYSSSLSQTNYQNQGWFAFQGNYFYRGVLGMSNTGALNYIRYNAGAGTYALRTTTNVIVASTVNMVAVTYDFKALGAGIRIYVNGKECSYATTTDGSGSIQTLGDICFATLNPDDGYGWLAGTIINSFAYTRILSPSEIQQLYQDPYCFIQQQGEWWYKTGEITPSYVSPPPAVYLVN